MSSLEINDDERQRIKDKVEKLKQSRFKQQMLPAWRPVPSFGSTMVIFFVFGFVFLLLGIALYVLSDRIQDAEMKYNELTACQGDSATSCTFTMEIEETIKQPIYVYYQLDNFYQNHRRYVKSKDPKQLMGVDRTVDQIKDTCTPIITNENLGFGANREFVSYPAGSTDIKVMSDNNKDLPANPCGLIAKSIFTDQYDIKPQGGASIAIDTSNIAWKSDVEYKYKACPDTAFCWLDVTQQAFIVWMRTAGLPNFRKLAGVINQDLDAGTYEVTVAANTNFGPYMYDVSSFNGSKTFVMSTTNIMGGRNYFLAICYICVGALCLMFSVIFFAAYMQRKGQNQGANEGAAQ